MVLINGYKVSRVVCLNCHRQWTAARPVETALADLECPKCGCVGDTIETGETNVTEDLLKKMQGQTERINRSFSEERYGRKKDFGCHLRCEDDMV